MKPILTTILLLSLVFNVYGQQEMTDIEKTELQRQLELKKFEVPATLDSKKTMSDSQGLPSGDADRDGLTDADEQTIGTNPTKKDTDGDGLWDSWEVFETNGIDLKNLGASPLHKDIFVEMDYMQRTSATNGLAPNQSVLLRISAVFANSPVKNPDNVNGINIHLIVGNEVTFDDNLDPVDDEFYKIKELNFDPRRAPFFHYMVWADSYDGSRSSGLSFGTPSSDFIVTLGRWNGGAGGTDDEKVGTFIHELGHNLGLRHGSTENLNYKANHLSVMNYFYQVFGVPRVTNGVTELLFEYQPMAIPALNENALAENNGLGNTPDLRGYMTRYFVGSSLANSPADGQIDWNGNGNINPGAVVSDLNRDSNLTSQMKTPNEWTILNFKGGTIGSNAALAGLFEKVEKAYVRDPVPELNEQDKIQIENALNKN